MHPHARETLAIRPAKVGRDALRAPLAAGQDRVQQDARRAVQQGHYVPLENVVRDALRHHPGKLLEVELDDGIYEVEILREDGVVVELDYDARNGKLLKTALVACCVTCWPTMMPSRPSACSPCWSRPPQS